METWYDYQTVWATHRWVMAYAGVVIAVLILAIVGTAVGVPPLAFLFVPALAGAYAHHIMVQRRLPRD